MRHVLFVSAITVAAFTYASGQVRDLSPEKGQIEDLKGVIKVYVGTSDRSASLSTTRTIIETVRKRLPQISFVALREEADVWLLVSAERDTETEINPAESVDGPSSTKVVTILRLRGRVIRFRGPSPAKLVKKFSVTGRSADGNSPARDFAEEFIKLYWKANPGKQSDATRHPEPDVTALLAGSTTTGDRGERALSNTPSQEPEPPLNEGKIEDLKGVTKIYVSAPDHYSSLFLRTIVETVRKEIPRLVFVWAREDADVWLLFSVESNLRDASVRGRIIRSLGPGRLRLVKQYSAKRSQGAEGFAKEFVKSYRKANPSPEADVARLQQATSSPPRLKRESSSPVTTGGLTSVRTASNSAEVGDGDILHIDTSLVTILANVIGRDGSPAPEMRQGDFSVYEDDVKQEIAFFEPVDRPFTVVLLIDSSTSVDAQLKEIVKVAKVLIDSLRPDDQLVIISFDAMVKEVLKLTKIRDLRGESVKISPQGGTRLYDAVDFAASQYLRRLPGRKAVVLLTDGVDFGSFITTAEGSLHDAEEYDALFYTVQYKTAEDQLRPAEKVHQEYERATAYLRELAEKTGGRHYRAEDMGDLSPAFTSIVKELSCQYSLGYYPTRPPQAGERRRIRVRVSRSDLVIHTRDSYIFKSPDAKPAEPK